MSTDDGVGRRTVLQAATALGIGTVTSGVASTQTDPEPADSDGIGGTDIDCSETGQPLESLGSAAVRIDVDKETYVWVVEFTPAGDEPQTPMTDDDRGGATSDA